MTCVERLGELALLNDSRDIGVDKRNNRRRIKRPRKNQDFN